MTACRPHAERYQAMDAYLSGLNEISILARYSGSESRSIWNVGIASITAGIDTNVSMQTFMHERAFRVVMGLPRGLQYTQTQRSLEMKLLEGALVRTFFVSHFSF